MHYTVAVVTKEDSDAEVERLLAPFDENLEVEPYICNTKAQIVERVRDRIAKLREDMKLFAEDKYDTERYRVYWLSEENVNPRTLQQYYAELLSCENKTDEEIYQWYRDGDDDDCYDENGNELSTYNPNSKWDWYSIGGRWDGYFLNKEGNTTNVEKISEVVWDGSDEDKEKAKRFWEIIVEGKPLKEGEKRPFTWYNEKYYLDRYHTKEEYAERVTRTCPYSVVTPEGEWVAPGEMHWFSSTETDEQQKEYEEWFSKFIAEHQDCYITLVDCHI